MNHTLAELAAYLEAGIEGTADSERIIEGVAGIEAARPGQLTFVGSAKFASHLTSTRASAVLVPSTGNGASAWRQIGRSDITFLTHPEPQKAFLRAVELFHPQVERPSPGVDRSARIGARVELGDGVHVGAHCVIDDDAALGAGSVILAGSFVGRHSRLGRGCCIGPYTTIMHDCTLGDRVRIHPATVIGADGFGYTQSDGRYVKVPQVGGVTIGDDVEIGSCCAVDRATLDQTSIGRGTKIDNLVMIGHNVRIGEHCIIISQVGISGSTKIGDRVTLAGQAGIVGHIEIGDGAIVLAQAGVSNDVPAGAVYLGSPARDVGHQKRIFAVENSLPNHVKTIRQLEKRVEELERQLTSKNKSS
ncbi:MAG TPA: UDP-3-O-(3-hydroxymyristoyl)glucosamine N-acyltransferase [candidate division Zixibacteria bacterium]|jgi:UDP-3-O-[3-hydroxymyristoyl] glucosamine N-acyltransferase